MNTKTRLRSYVERSPLLPRLRPAWGGVFFLVVVTLLFTTIGSSYENYVFDTILLTCLGAISLQVLQGTAGLVSIGTAAFLCVGGFSSVFFLRAGVPFPLDLVGATVVSGVGGLIVGLPALRLKSLFLALATLAAQFIATFLGNYYQSVVPSAQSGGFYVPLLFASKGLADSAKYWAWLLVVVLALAILGASRIMAERSGRALRLIRDQEHIAPTLGIPVARYKLTIFVMSSMVIGFQGALLAHFTGSVLSDNYTVTLAFQYVAMIVIGGLDSLPGAIIGATIVVALPDVVPSLVNDVFGSSAGPTIGSNVALILYGVILILFIVSSPDGVVGMIRRLTQRLTLSERR